MTEELTKLLASSSVSLIETPLIKELTDNIINEINEKHLNDNIN